MAGATVSMAVDIFHRASRFYGSDYLFSGEKLPYAGSFRNDQLDQDVEPWLFLGFVLSHPLAGDTIDIDRNN
ncbi:MAG: hypothetical protein F4239_02730, partial [Gammaproteobacteria bacterium]|nr:hypothetical protein [Gammaproteobacteria bacterium]